MQYLGGKNRIKKDIAEIINNEICRREVKNSNANSRNNQQLCGGGGGNASCPFSVEVV